MANKKEIEKLKEMNKAIKDIDNKWEAMAFIWAYRRREVLMVLLFVSMSINIIILAKYTQFFEWGWKTISSIWGK